MFMQTNLFESPEYIKDKLTKIYEIFLEKDVNSEEYKRAIDEFLELSDTIIKRDHLGENGLIIELLKEVSNVSRIFPYRDTFAKYIPNFIDNDNPFFNAVDRFYTVEGSDKPIHTYLYEVYKFFLEHRRVIISAPTSFGKTKLLFDILNKEKYDKSIIILPTNALTDEIVAKLYEEENLRDFIIMRDVNDYTSIHKNLSESKIILVLTPEKALDLFFTHKDIVFDFGVMDETHMIDPIEGSSRSPIISNTLYHLTKQNRTRDLYCIGPYFDKFKNVKKLGIKFKKMNTNLVAKKEILLPKGKTKIDSIAEKLSRFRYKGESTIVYCPEKSDTESQARIYSESVKNEDESSNARVGELIEYIEKEILNKGHSWKLIYCLKSGVAFHHAGVPREILLSIVDLFNDRMIDAIFCTSTLVEGVNLIAKNIIFYQLTSQYIKDISKIKFKNIVGRSGRLGEHFIGNSYIFENDKEDKPSDTESTNIGLQEYSLKKTNELLIQMEIDDLNKEDIKEFNLIKERLKDIDIRIIKENRFINIDGQIKLVKELREFSDKDFLELKDISFSKNDNDESNLHKIINLSCISLFNKEEKKKIILNKDFREKGKFTYTTKQLAYFYSIYIDSFDKNYNPIKVLYEKISSGDEDIDKRISETTKFISEYCSFTLPKYIEAFFVLYGFVYRERTGEEFSRDEYSELINGKEKINSPKILLKLFNIPNNIIGDIEKYFKDCKNTIDIREACKKQMENMKKDKNITPYKLRILSKYFGIKFIE